MAQQFLHRADVVAGLQQVGGERMVQGAVSDFRAAQKGKTNAGSPSSQRRLLLFGPVHSIMLKLFFAAVAVMAGVLAWGYWHSATHASLSLRVEDYGLQTDRQLYGTPHAVTLTYYDAAGEFLAAAHSIEPAGYVLAIHPDSDIGDCSQYENSREKYARCFTSHSTWASHWAPCVRSATVQIGACVLEKLPVSVYSSNSEWWLWWVPLPHVGGVPRRYFDLAVKVNTRSCPAAFQ